jgi:hypothetical protein
LERKGRVNGILILLGKIIFNGEERINNILFRKIFSIFILLQVSPRQWRGN